MGEEHIPKNGGKAPSYQMYPNDWSRDLEEHPLEIEGAWIRLVNKLWYSPTKGAQTRTLDQWSRVMRESPKRTLEILDYIRRESIGEVVFHGTGGEVFEDPVTFRHNDSNGSITVSCRRMVRDEKLRAQNRARQATYRGKEAGKKAN